MPTDEAARPYANAPFPYMRFAKERLQGSPLRNLGLSGTPPPTRGELVELGLDPITAVDEGVGALRAALAARYEIDASQVHPAVGSSHANFATALALARGGHLVVESPGYEAFAALGPAVGARVSTFRRDPECQWALDGESLRDATKSGVSLIFVSNLHNPSGVRLTPAEIEMLQTLATAHDAYVVVDEVYADFDPEQTPSAVHWGERFIATNSLTKVHGLGDLRCGWILAAPELIERIAVWDDIVCPAHSPHGLLQGARYLPQSESRAARIRARALDRQTRVGRWLETVDELSWVAPHGGITGFMRAGDGSGQLGDLLVWHAEARYGVQAVPGSYFQAPGWLRVSFDLEPGELGIALDGLAQAARDVLP